MTQTITLDIDDTYHGKRLDSALGALIESHSRNALQEMITDGKVSVDGKLITKPSYKLISGNQIEVQIESEETTDIEAQNIPLNVVFASS